MAVNTRGGYSVFTDPRIIILGTLALIWLCGAAAATLTGVGEKSLGWPAAIIANDGSWSTGATVMTIVFLSVVIAGVIALTRLFKDDLKSYKVAAASMPAPHKLHHVSAKDAKTTGASLVPPLVGTDAQAGIKLGHTLIGGKPLFLDWESTMLATAGPRMGKTTALALPAIITAPGAVITTSNKSDIFHQSVDYRMTQGSVWCFDPQNVAGSTNMWWNPLRRVTDYPSAQKLTGWLAAGAGHSDETNQTNRYFQDEGTKLLSILILAAAKGGGDLKHVYDWLKNIESEIPVLLLREAGLTDPAGDLRAIQAMETRQRDGVIGFARQPVALLTYEGFAQYVTPDYRVNFRTDQAGLVVKDTVTGIHKEPLTHFDTSSFAASKDTLYALSLEGMGSAAGLVTALTGEVLEEAVNFAAGQGGRLPIPMVAVLDEAANVCKMAELPKQYSHFGSRGIIPITIVQSPAQAKDVWGDNGWEKLKSSSAVRFYGGNVDDDGYPTELSNKIGEHEVSYSSRSSGSSGNSYSNSVQRERILEVSDLAALPKELAVIQSPGNKPVLIRKDFIFNNKALRNKINDAQANSQVNAQTNAQYRGSSTAGANS